MSAEPVDLAIYRDQKDGTIALLEDCEDLLELCEMHDRLDARIKALQEVRDYIKGGIRPYLTGKKSMQVGAFALRLSDKTVLYCGCHRDVATACPENRLGARLDVYPVAVDPWLSIRRKNES